MNSQKLPKSSINADDLFCSLSCHIGSQKRETNYFSLRHRKKKSCQKNIITTDGVNRIPTVPLNFAIYEVCLKSNGTGSINFLFYLTSKFYNMSPSK